MRSTFRQCTTGLVVVALSACTSVRGGIEHATVTTSPPAPTTSGAPSTTTAVTTTVPSLKRQGLMAKFIPDNARRLPSQFIDAEGEWVAGNFYVQQPIYNTELIKRGAVINVSLPLDQPNPGMFPGPLGASLAGKAEAEGRWRLHTINIRDHAVDKHRTVDDSPCGGGAGMVMRADVVDSALAEAEEETPGLPAIDRKSTRLNSSHT